jgi:hypothetical protein
MSNLADRPPVEHKSFERSATVDGLFVTTMRGAVIPLEGSVASTTLPQNSQWQNTYTKLKSTLLTQSQNDNAPAIAAKAKILTDQLEALNLLPTPDRVATLKSLKSIDSQISLAQRSFDKVHESLAVHNLRQAFDTQNELISTVDKLNANEISSRIHGMQRVSDSEQNPAVKGEIQESIKDAQCLLASPFIERARLAAMQIQDNRFYQAAKTLNDALALQIPQEALQSPQIKALKEDARVKAADLNLQNNLQQVFNQYLPTLDIHHEGFVSRQDLKDATKNGISDASLKTLTQFLSDNYDYLTTGHPWLFGKNGITRTDIDSYAKNRNKQMNDIDLRF